MIDHHFPHFPHFLMVIDWGQSPCWTSIKASNASTDRVTMAGCGVSKCRGNAILLILFKSDFRGLCNSLCPATYQIYDSSSAPQGHDRINDGLRLVGRWKFVGPGVLLFDRDLLRGGPSHLYLRMIWTRAANVKGEATVAEPNLLVGMFIWDLIRLG